MSGSTFTEVSIRGTLTRVPAICIEGRTFTVTGKWVKIAVVKDEDMVEGETVANPASVIEQVKRSDLKADIVTFAQKLPDLLPKHDFYFEQDNLAVINITTYRSWFEGIGDAVQRAIKKSKKLGILVKEVEFTDSYVEGIKGIYDETPVRQGKLFWHYGKSFDAVKKQNSTFPDRSTYLGAYHNDELIGCVWLVHVDKAAHMIQIISKVKDYVKRPANARASAA